MAPNTVSTNLGINDLPEYDNPPVVEVVLSVQFSPLLNTGHLGLMWGRFRDRFRTLEEKSPLQPMIELFGVKHFQISEHQLRLSFSEIPPTPRCWLINETEKSLIQVQSDRFIFNWRKPSEHAEYVRFMTLLPYFKKEYERFTDFLSDEGMLDKLDVNQCEITYVNHIGLPEKESTHERFREIMSLFNQGIESGFLPDPENVDLSLRYIIRDEKSDPIGRLHVSIKPQYLKDEQDIYSMNLTVRGKPIGEGIDGIIDFFKLGRRWIVKGFTELTSEEMHRLWRRKK